MNNGVMLVTACKQLYPRRRECINRLKVKEKERLKKKDDK